MSWKVRGETDGVEVGMLAPDYGSNKEYFSIRLHHGGNFMNLGNTLAYTGGKVDHIDYCTYDEMSKTELFNMAVALGLAGKMEFYYNCSTVDDCQALIHVAKDSDAMDIALYVGNERCCGVFVDHEQMNPKDLAFHHTDLGKIQPPSYIEGNDDVDARFENIEIVEEMYPNENEQNMGGAAENENGEGCWDYIMTSMKNLVDERDQTGSDCEVSVGSDSVHSDYYVDSDGNYEIDDKDYYKFVDSEAEWFGLRQDKGKEPAGGESQFDFDDEAEREHYVPKHKGYKVFNPDVDMDNVKLEIGLCFNKMSDFREAVKKQAIDMKKEVVFPQNNKMKCQAKCKNKNCGWTVYASRVPKDDTVVLKTYVKKHTCPRLQKITHANVSWLAKTYGHLIMLNPSWPVDSMIATLREKHGITFSRWQMYRLKHKVLGSGSECSDFKDLYRYAEEIFRTNPGTTVKIQSKLVANHRVFERVYICWNALKMGMLSGCRRVIFLDGCHIKTVFGGVLLTACGLDANNCMYPFAYAVVEKERYDSWLWFIGLLVADLEIEEPYLWTVISDKQKGLVDATDAKMNGAEHRFCVYHLWCNFKLQFKGLSLKDILWRAAKATRPIDFQRVMKELEAKDDKAHEWLSARDPKHWSKAFFGTLNRSDVILNNISESFNSMLRKPRKMPFLRMLEAIRVMLMKRIAIRSSEMKQYIGFICPKTQQLVNDNAILSEKFDANWNGYNQFEVTRDRKEYYVVHLGERTCTCRKWQLSGIPCAHAIRCFQRMGYNTESYVDNCYKVETFLRIYGNFMNPMVGQHEWPEPTDERDQLNPPVITTMPGRPKKYKRKLQSGEKKKKNAPTVVGTKLTRHGTQMTCTVCKQMGHNMRTCPLTTAESRVKSSKDKKKCIASKSNAASRKGSKNKGKEPLEPSTGQEASSFTEEGSYAELKRKMKGKDIAVHGSPTPYEVSKRMSTMKKNQGLFMEPKKLPIKRKEPQKNDTKSTVDGNGSKKAINRIGEGIFQSQPTIRKPSNTRKDDATHDKSSTQPELKNWLSIPGFGSTDTEFTFPKSYAVYKRLMK